ncbi:unnamed protein product [Symbiodinium sp. CCMP2592]|nr:unnamed protein product [Symbiodinium sp. CCMP2592]
METGSRRSAKPAPNSSLRKMSAKEIRSMKRAQKAATKAYNKMKEAREEKVTDTGDTGDKEMPEPASVATVDQTLSADSKHRARPRKAISSKTPKPVPSQPKPSGGKKGSIRESFARSGRIDPEAAPILPATTAGAEGTSGTTGGTSRTHAEASSSSSMVPPGQDDIMIQRQQQLLAMQQYAAKRRAQIKQQALLVQQRAADDAANSTATAGDSTAEPIERVNFTSYGLCLNILRMFTL